MRRKISPWPAANVMVAKARLRWTNGANGLNATRSRETTLKSEDRGIPVEVLRELLVNAYVHRCYQTHAPIQIKVRPGEVEIVNPG